MPNKSQMLKWYMGTRRMNGAATNSMIKLCVTALHMDFIARWVIIDKENQWRMVKANSRLLKTIWGQTKLQEEQQKWSCHNIKVLNINQKHPSTKHSKSRSYGGPTLIPLVKKKLNNKLSVVNGCGYSRILARSKSRQWAHKIFNVQTQIGRKPWVTRR